MDDRYNILIADSYPDESKQLKEELQKQYNVMAIAENGEDAFSGILNLRPDLVIIDLMLP